MNILFTSSGRRVELLELFRRALEKLGIDGQIVAADVKKTAPTLFFVDHREQVPTVDDPDYVPMLMDICRRQGIRLLVPLIDSELEVLSANLEAFASLGVTVLVSSPETNRICIDKRQTGNFLRSHGIASPALYSTDEALDVLDRKPLFIKPARGSSSIGTACVRTPEELRFHLEHLNEPIIQEFVEGAEYTLDILNDFSGKVCCVVPRLRLETRAGESSKGITVRDQELIETGREVAEALPGAFGCLTLQCFRRPDGKILVIEINPRFGGGFPLSAAAGADFPRAILSLLSGKDPRPDLRDWEDGKVMLRYDAAVYLNREQIG